MPSSPCPAPRRRQAVRVLCAAAPLLAGCGGLFPDVAADAGGSGAAVALEALDAAGRQALDSYAAAPPDKAFAVADGGAWGWQGGETSLAAAQDRALERCQAIAAVRACHVVAWDAGNGWAAADPTPAGRPPGAEPPPLDDPGVAAFQTFVAATGNKAFAVSPDGAWGWRASATLPLEAVQEEARATCARHAEGCQVVVSAPDVRGLASLPR